MAKIVVIEDADDVRANLVELLEAEDHEVWAGHNGLVGLELVRHHLPDLILCDVLMPEMDGHGVLAELRRDSRTTAIPFIFLTARADRREIRDGMVMGADDYLTKPYTRSEVLQAIATRLNRQATTTDIFEKKLDELRHSMAQMLPHELRTPLASILGYSSLLLDGFETMQADEVREMLGSIRQDGERLHRLIQKFLWYVELELAGSNPERVAQLRQEQTCNAGRLLCKVAYQKAREFNRSADLQMETAEAGVAVGEIHLTRLTEEVVENAFKFSRPGTPVALSARSGPEGMMHISITDRGRGMTPEQIAQIGAYRQFERHKYEQQGSGMGLAIARRIAELHGGALAIRSEPGCFTAVEVSLPAG